MFRGEGTREIIDALLLRDAGEKVAEGRMRGRPSPARSRFAALSGARTLSPLRGASGVLMCFALVLLFSCQRTGPSWQQMGLQPKYDPLVPSDFFADGMSARPRIPGTVARGEIDVDPYLATGKINGQDGDGFPFPVTPEVMQRGHERFDIYCSPCHGRLGDGNGMIPSRGFRHPPSYHTDTLRAAKTGHFFDVMTNGFGAMPSYRTQIPPRDRWAIIAYIRALQLSQGATVNDVPAPEQAKLNGGPAQ